MTPDEQNTFAANMAAHEQVLTMLLSFYFDKLSAEQRNALEQGMNAPPDMASSSFAEYDLDIGTHDDLAGLAMLYRDAMNRIHRRALQLVDSRREAREAR